MERSTPITEKERFSSSKISLNIKDNIKSLNCTLELQDYFKISQVKLEIEKKWNIKSNTFDLYTQNHTDPLDENKTLRCYSEIIKNNSYLYLYENTPDSGKKTDSNCDTKMFPSQLEDAKKLLDNLKYLKGEFENTSSQQEKSKIENLKSSLSICDTKLSQTKDENAIKYLILRKNDYNYDLSISQKILDFLEEEEKLENRVNLFIKRNNPEFKQAVEKINNIKNEFDSLHLNILNLNQELFEDLQTFIYFNSQIDNTSADLQGTLNVLNQNSNNKNNNTNDDMSELITIFEQQINLNNLENFQNMDWTELKNLLIQKCEEFKNVILPRMQQYKPDGNPTTKFEHFTSEFINLKKRVMTIKDDIKREKDNKIIESKSFSSSKQNKELVIKKSLEDLINFTSDYTNTEIDRKINLYELSKLLIPEKEDLQKSEKIFSDIPIIEGENFENMRFIFLVLRKLLEENKITLVLKDKINYDLGRISLHILMSGDLFAECQSAVLEETEELSFNILNQDENLKNKFFFDFKECVSEALKISYDRVRILGIEKGSIRVNFEIVDDAAGNIIEIVDKSVVSDALNKSLGTSARLELHRFFTFCQLSPELLDVKGNFNFKNHKFEEHKRGGFKYFQPLTWKRYGLNVSKKYDNQNDEWLNWKSNKESPNAWVVGFHGTPNAFDNNINIVQNIIQNSLRIDGKRHMYEKHICTITNKEVGKGAYLSNHVEVCERYAKGIQVGNNNYKLIFQCRLKPDAIRIPQKLGDIKQERDWNDDYWIVNNSNHIRPYGILLKKI